MQKNIREFYEIPSIETLQLPYEALCQESTHYASGLEEVSEETYEW